jgi:hypothetical protein
LATKLSNSAWMNCFQRKTRIEAPGSGAGPFQVGAARATPPGRSNRLAAAPDCRALRLVMSPTFSSLVGARAQRRTGALSRLVLHLSGTRRHGVTLAVLLAPRLALLDKNSAYWFVLLCGCLSDRAWGVASEEFDCEKTRLKVGLIDNS